MNPGEIALWLGRIVTVVPAIIELWKAAEGDDDHETLEASLALVRSMKDQQARETIGR